MIPEPHPYEPDDPTSYDDAGDDFRSLLPGWRQERSLIDPLDPVEY
jgi:hypothetical protein